MSYKMVMSVAGLVVPIFLNQSKSGYFNVTDKQMTRLL